MIYYFNKGNKLYISRVEIKNNKNNKNNKMTKLGILPDDDTIYKLMMLKTKKDENSECLLWKGYSKDGYNEFSYKKNRIAVARFLYSYYNKDWDKKDVIRRTCKNMVCVNINHLCISSEIEINYDDEWNRLVKKSFVNENGCRIWTASVSQTSGYPKTRLRNTHYSVHRLSFLISRKLEKIPDTNDNGDRLIVRHLCNTILCFEPTHLEIGTFFQNNKDDKIKDGTFLLGEDHSRCKITNEIAKTIKHNTENLSIKEFAEKFELHESTIRKINSNTRWSHIPDKNGIVKSNKRKQEKYKNPNFQWTKEAIEIVKKKLIENTIISTVQSTLVTGKCILWNKALRPGNYGYFRVLNRIKPSHVWSYEMNTLTIVEKGLVVRHKCNVTLCCNFDHLEIGTNKQNALDCINTNNCSRISSIEKVMEIRSTYNLDDLNLEERCIKYGMKKGALRNIEKYKTFSHVIVLDVNLKFEGNSSAIKVNFSFDRYNKIVS